MLDSSIVFVDLETTGANPVDDRVIEIGIVKVTAGAIEYEWDTLVDPQTPIPPAIQGFTGISDEMVRGAPTFGAIADEVAQRLGDSLFVAHNARFDAGFLKSEFRRLGRPFPSRVLCTVKLSRALYPQHHRHGLDAIIARHGLACTARHRALGDARVLWEFMQLIEREHAPQTIEQAVTKAMKRPKLPPDLVPDTLDHVPEAPGVYVFYGENEVPLYVGRSLNLRSRVQAHFTGDQSAGRALRIAREIRRVDWIETGGELGALLLESQLVKEKAPIHNRHLRGQGESCSWRTCDDPGQGPPLDLVWVRDLDCRELGRLHGLFRSRREATNTLREIASAYQLCPKRLGLEAGRGACFALPLKKCRGVCVGRESAAVHDLRLRAALSSLRLKPWPFAGRIAIREEDGERGREYFHVFDAWCHVGTESTQSGLYEAAARRGDPVFDADTYRILIRYLAREPKGIIDLARAAV